MTTRLAGPLAPRPTATERTAGSGEPGPSATARRRRSRTRPRLRLPRLRHHNLRHDLRRRRVAASAAAHDAVDDHHPHARQVAGGDAGEEVCAGAALGARQEDEVGRPAGFQATVVEALDAGGSASTPSNCTAPTAICCTSSSRPSPTGEHRLLRRGGHGGAGPGMPRPNWAPAWRPSRNTGAASPPETARCSARPSAARASPMP